MVKIREVFHLVVQHTIPLEINIRLIIVMKYWLFLYRLIFQDLKI